MISVKVNPSEEPEDLVGQEQPEDNLRFRLERDSYSALARKCLGEMLPRWTEFKDEDVDGTSSPASGLSKENVQKIMFDQATVLVFTWFTKHGVRPTQECQKHLRGIAETIAQLPQFIAFVQTATEMRKYHEMHGKIFAGLQYYFV